MNWKIVLKRLEYWRSQDEKWQKAMKQFCEVIAPDEYAPILSPNYVESFIAGIDIDGDGSETSLGSWLSYWVYEVPMFKDIKKCEVKDRNGNKYDFKKRKDVIKFLKNNY